MNRPASIEAMPSRKWAIGLAGAFIAVAGGLVFAGVSLPPQERDLALYLYLVAGLLLICGVAAWVSQASPDASLPASIRRSISAAQWLITSIAWAYPLSLYAYAGVAFIIVGHWPYYGHPDPKDLDLPVLHGSVLLSLFVSAIGILAWAICFPIGSRALGSSGIRLHALAFLVGICVLLLVVFRDPFGVGEWYAD